MIFAYGAEKKRLDDRARTIKKEDFPGTGVDNLRAKLETRAKKTSQALDEGKLKEAEEMIAESRRLIDNARFFLKADPVIQKAKIKESKESDQKSEKLKSDLEHKKASSTEEMKKGKENAKSGGRRKNN